MASTEVTVNCDMGESFGILSLCDDAKLLQYVDIVNVACGFHSGDFSVMSRTVEAAKRNRVKVF